MMALSLALCCACVSFIFGMHELVTRLYIYVGQSVQDLGIRSCALLCDLSVFDLYVCLSLSLFPFSRDYLVFKQ